MTLFLDRSGWELRPQSACSQLRGDETCVVFSEFCRALRLTSRAKIVAKQIARLFHICVRARARSECKGSGLRLRDLDPYLIRRANGHAFIWRKR